MGTQIYEMLQNFNSTHLYINGLTGITEGEIGLQSWHIWIGKWRIVIRFMLYRHIKKPCATGFL